MPTVMYYMYSPSAVIAPLAFFICVAMGWAGWANSRDPPSAGAPEFQAEKLKILLALQWVKRLTDLQILGRELHRSAFGPAGEERVGNRERRKGREGKDVKG